MRAIGMGRDKEFLFICSNDWKVVVRATDWAKFLGLETEQGYHDDECLPWITAEQLH